MSGSVTVSRDTLSKSFVVAIASSFDIIRIIHRIPTIVLMCGRARIECQRCDCECNQVLNFSHKPFATYQRFENDFRYVCYNLRGLRHIVGRISDKDGYCILCAVWQMDIATVVYCRYSCLRVSGIRSRSYDRQWHLSR